MIHTTVKHPCTCTHEWQDKEYGKGKRVMNSTAKQDKDFMDVRCTVCSKVHRLSHGQIKGKK